MKKIIFAALCLLSSVFGISAQSALPSSVVLTPYIVNDAATPQADKILKDKLERIVTKYGVSGQLQSPFIITAHAIELSKETTATAPPRTAVKLSLTFYIGNGEEGTLFSSCNMEVSGVGSSPDGAYAASFRKINVNDPELTQAIDKGRERIKEYYAQAGPGLLKKAEAQAAAGNYAAAYDVLLRIPPICPQYEQAQNLLIGYIHAESDAQNGDLVAKARAAWSTSPDENGAAQARQILAGMTNASPKMRASAEALMKEMGSRLQHAEDARMAQAAKEQANEHAERMAAIDGATKVAVARAKNRPVYHYHVHWW